MPLLSIPDNFHLEFQINYLIALNADYLSYLCRLDIRGILFKSELWRLIWNNSFKSEIIILFIIIAA